jgi:formimidoylglutamate deiminase
MQRVRDVAVPVHIHIAEQTAEVDDCLASAGARPIEWLCRELRPDARWQLVHATHATPSEIDAVAASGASIVVCPSTEANLGDGLTDLPRWLTAGVPIGLGSDSQVSRSWPAELRCLEYGQRLVRRKRNVAAAPRQDKPATAAYLFDTIVAGDGRSAGQMRWGLVPGARADAIVLDTRSPGLMGVPPSHALDALVFATDAPEFREVYVGGHRVITEGRHAEEVAISQRFSAAMDELWAGSTTPP